MKPCASCSNLGWFISRHSTQLFFPWMFLYYPQTRISSLLSGSPIFWISNLSRCDFALYQLKLKLYFPECPTWYGSLLALIARVILLQVWKMEGKQGTYFLHLEGWYKTQFIKPLDDGMTYYSNKGFKKILGNSTYWDK